MAIRLLEHMAEAPITGKEQQLKFGSNIRLPMLGIFAVCALFVFFFSMIQLVPLLHLNSEDLVTYKGRWYPENSETVVPEEAERQTYTAYQKVLTTGNLRNNYWVKLRVRNTGVPTSVMIGPAFIDEVDVWQKGPNGQWQLDKGGIRRGFAEREYGTLFLSVPVWRSPEQAIGAESELLVNIKTTASFMQARAYPLNEVTEYDAGLRMSFGVYLGISLWVLTVCLVVWLATGDRVWLDALMYDLAFTYYASAQTGMLYKLFPDITGQLASAIFALSVLSITLTMCRFTIISTGLFKRPDWLVSPYKLGYLVCLVAFGLILSSNNPFALTLVNLYLIFTCLWGFVLLFKLREGDPVLLNTYRLLLLLYSSIPLVYVGSSFFQKGLTDTMVYISSGQNSFFTMVMIMMLLGFRAWNISREQFRLGREKELLATRLAIEEEKLAEASSFLGMIVHEVKNPLNYIRLAIANLANEKELSPYATRTLKKIEKSVNNIDNVLERSIEAEDQAIQSLVIRKKNTNINRLLDELLSSFSPEERSRFKLRTEPKVTAEIDNEVLSMALRNLMENAIKYAADFTSITLDLQVLKGNLVIRVSNQPGEAGYPDETQLFQKFYRSRDALHISGTGLGLYWVRKAMRRMDGDVTYTRLNNSICFEICLPA